MNPYQFLKEIQTIPTGSSNAGGGDGFKRTITLPLLSTLRTTAGLVLTAGTAPAITAFETNYIGVQVAASATAIGSFQLTLPADYDGASDFFQVVVHAQTGGTTDAPTVSGTLFQKRDGTALSASIASNAATSTYTASVPKSTAVAAAAFIDFSGKGLQAGDALFILPVTSAHTTDAVNIYTVDVYYKSNLVFSNMAKRS